MAKFWFVSAPLRSHTDWGGMLLTALHLKRLGQEVDWLSGTEIADFISDTPINSRIINETGWNWPPPPMNLDELAPMEAMKQRYIRALDTWLNISKVKIGCEEIIRQLEFSDRPDVIVSDPFLPAAAIAAEKMGIHFVVVGMPALRPLLEEALFPVQKDLAVKSVDRLHELFQYFRVIGRNFSDGAAPSVQSSELHISYFTKSWFQADLQNLLSQNVFFGGALRATNSNKVPQWMRNIPREAPLALITLGTTFRGELGFYAWAANAATKAGLIPIITLGEHSISPEEKQELISSLPPTSHLFQWISFRQVLPRTKLAFQHGGMGTNHALALHGIPQIVVPHAADQRAQARRVAQAKVGLHLSAHDVRQGMLKDAASALVHDESVKENARLLSEEMRSLGGAAKAAEVLVQLAETA